MFSLINDSYYIKNNKKQKINFDVKAYDLKKFL